jgi:hypothetical protein
MECAELPQAAFDHAYSSLALHYVEDLGGLKDCFLKDELARVGVNDTYHRNIWCQKRDMNKVNLDYRRDFGGSA